MFGTPRYPMSKEKSTQASTVEPIDIREAIYFRIASSNVRSALTRGGPMTHEIETALARRFFPSLFEEAHFWFLAGRGRGAVVLTASLIEFVPQTAIRRYAFQTATRHMRECLMTVLREYDPFSQAVVAMVYPSSQTVVFANSTGAVNVDLSAHHPAV
ncbi:MAG TPA: hypothetical protein VNH18_12635 [Bryobacteraceae bacterium]|nr:hypothetical protein [Bryobacteraceae bacterium]